MKIISKERRQKRKKRMQKVERVCTKEKEKMVVQGKDKESGMLKKK